MKAFKQISMLHEKKFVWSYATLLSILSIFVLVTPLLAQESDSLVDKPKIDIHVNKKFDKQGNLQRYDSTYSWSWSGSNLQNKQMDSLMNTLPLDFRGMFKQGYSFSPGTGLGFGTFKDPWGTDSSGTDNFNFPLDKDLYSQFFNDVPDLFRWNYPEGDSTMNPGGDNGNSNGSSQDMNKLHQQYLDNFRKYQEENRKLIEKYFGNPKGEQPDKGQLKQNNYVPSTPEDPNKIGKT